MPISGDNFFPKWIVDNYVLFPPVVFFIAVLFGWGVFTEIDERLMFAVSFADFMLLFVVFLSVAIILIFVLIGLASPVLRRWSAWIVQREVRASSVLNILMFVAMLGSGFLSGIFNIIGGFITGAIVFFLFLVPALSARTHSDVDRFRKAVIISLLGLSWMVSSSGRLVGRILVDGPKRVYLIKLQGGPDLYANIVLYLSSGIVYKVGSEIFYSPNDALLFTRRTGIRREM